MITLRKRELAARFKVSMACINQWVTKGKIPKPFYLGTQIPLWDEADINQLLEKLKGEANGTSGSKTEGVSAT